jgi:DNA-binding transcriptional ArsR family regulator
MSDTTAGKESDAGQQARREIRDPGVMRALAHPARLTLMERLMSGAPATATECAEVIGLSPSATSYHLRALARAGLIEEAPGRGDGRERVWRSQVRGYDVEAGHEAGTEAREAERELIDSFLIREGTRVRQWLAHSHEEPLEWYRASLFTEAGLMLTVEEMAEIGQRFMEVLEPYRGRSHVNPPPGTRPVSVLVRAFPTDQLRTSVLIGAVSTDQSLSAGDDPKEM